MRIDEANSPTQLFDGNFDFLWLGFLCLWQRNSENAVFIGGTHLRGINSRRQGDAAAEFPTEALGPLGILAFTRRALAFAGDRQHSVMQRDVDVLLAHARYLDHGD